ncbi:MAG: hypothetical protein R2867_07975 [Caldilineaceae bacterium]
MSEYQYYEFRTINRQLTAGERTAVNKLSSHGHTTATSFSVEYNWGNFKHDTDEVLAKYFDIFFYITNWGSIELKFCYPLALVDQQLLEPYCIEEELTVDIKRVQDRVILTFESHAEGGGDWVEGEGMLDDLVDLYNQILQGDHRIFYLAWLGAAEWSYEYSEYLDEETLEPPVPPGLDNLSPALQAFIKLFGIGKDLVAVAAKGSAREEPPSDIDVQQALDGLSKAECVDFLQRFLAGEAHLDLRLKQRLGLVQPVADAGPTGTRTVGELLAAQDEIKQAQAAMAAAEKAAKRQAELDALAARGGEPWREVEALIEEKKRESYQQAAKLLRNLRELAEAQGQSQQFQQRLDRIRSEYSRRPALIEELRHL